MNIVKLVGYLGCCFTASVVSVVLFPIDPSIDQWIRSMDDLQCLFRYSVITSGLVTERPALGVILGATWD